MGNAITKPTDTTDANYQFELDRYDAEVQEIRVFISPDTGTFTDEDIPTAELDSGNYLLPAERKVLRDSGLTAIPARTDAVWGSFLYMVQIDTALRYLPRAAQITRQGVMQEVTQYSEIELEERESRLKALYEEERQVVNPSGKSLSGINTNVVLTQSRLIT